MKLLKINQVADMVGLAEKTLRKHVANRQIPYVKIMGALRFDEQEIESWIESKRVDSINVEGA